MNFQNHNLGTRIRYYRQKNGLTQKQLGEAIGVVESAIRNYELGKRTPNIETLQNIALELGIDFYTLYSPYHFDIRASIHAFFQMQDLYGLEPEEVNGEIVLKVNKNESDLNPYLECWYQAFKSFKDNKISEQDYSYWMDAFPTFAGIDENGLPVWGKELINLEEFAGEKLEESYEIYIIANTWAGKKNLMSFEEYKEFRKKNDNK